MNIKINKELGTLNFLINLWHCLHKKRKLQLLVLLLVMFASAFSEVLSLASLIPFLKIISNPLEIIKIKYVGSFFLKLGVYKESTIVILTSIIFSIVIILTAIVRLYNIYLNGKLSASIGGDLSYEAYKSSIYQDYDYHLENNSSESLNTITGQINITIAVINRTLQFFTSSIVSISIFSALIIFNPKIAISTGFLFLLSYLLIILNVKGKLLKNTYTFVKASEDQLREIQEGFGSIRDILLENNQQVYLNNFKKYDKPMRNSVANTQFLESFPRYALEAIGICSISFIAITINSQENYSDSEFLTTLGTIALGAQRLLPALQQSYASWAAVKGGCASVKKVLDIINLGINKEIYFKSNKKLKFKNYISFKNVNYSYRTKNSFSLKKINLNINKGETLGIVGATGSGKSTFINLIMGLLEPEDGRIFLDDVDLYSSRENVSIWRQNISHVPQSIFLADLSLAENIAFGVPKEEIDFEKIKRVARMAKISQFIDSLPNSYQTYVGENGVRLSGGQRQRIGIARSLYKEKEILILDEATSALDEETEKEVMEGFYKLNKEITIIMISHRISTLRRCDRIIEFSDGKIINT